MTNEIRTIKTSGSRTVDFVGRMNFSGNIIPDSWYHHILRDNGKPNLTAIIVLSEIVQMYTHKKFNYDKLKVSYQYFSDKFGISKREATNAIVSLESLGIIKREFRTLKVCTVVQRNVLFIDLNVDKLLEIGTY